MSEEERDDERTVAAEEHEEAVRADSAASVALGLLIPILGTYFIPGEISPGE